MYATVRLVKAGTVTEINTIAFLQDLPNKKRLPQILKWQKDQRLERERLEEKRKEKSGLVSWDGTRVEGRDSPSESGSSPLSPNVLSREPTAT